jgi:hypothetical protein
MDIAWFRDLILITFGLVATAGIIIFVVLALKFYSQAMPTLKSLRKTTKTVEKISCGVELEVAGPLGQVVAFVQGIRQAVSLVRGLMRDKEED